MARRARWAPSGPWQCRRPRERLAATGQPSWRRAVGASTRSMSFSFAPHTRFSRRAMGIGRPASSAVTHAGQGANVFAQRPVHQHRGLAFGLQSVEHALHTGGLPGQHGFGQLETRRSAPRSARLTPPARSSVHPAGYSSASFCTSWWAASKLPSTRSAKNCSVRCPASPDGTRCCCRDNRWAIHCGKALRVHCVHA
jgi:hypothetical protein